MNRLLAGQWHYTFDFEIEQDNSQLYSREYLNHVTQNGLESMRFRANTTFSPDGTMRAEHVDIITLDLSRNSKVWDFIVQEYALQAPAFLTLSMSYSLEQDWSLEQIDGEHFSLSLVLRDNDLSILGLELNGRPLEDVLEEAPLRMGETPEQRAHITASFLTGMSKFQKSFASSLIVGEHKVLPLEAISPTAFKLEERGFTFMYERADHTAHH